MDDWWVICSVGNGPQLAPGAFVNMLVGAERGGRLTRVHDVGAVDQRHEKAGVGGAVSPPLHAFKRFPPACEGRGVILRQMSPGCQRVSRPPSSRGPCAPRGCPRR